MVAKNLPRVYLHASPLALLPSLTTRPKVSKQKLGAIDICAIFFEPLESIERALLAGSRYPKCYKKTLAFQQLEL